LAAQELELLQELSLLEHRHYHNLLSYSPEYQETQGIFDPLVCQQ